MQKFQDFLVWLDGKKMVIVSLLSIIVPFAAQSGIISNEVANLIMQIIGVLSGGAVIAVNQAIKNETPLGVAIINKRINKK